MTDRFEMLLASNARHAHRTTITVAGLALAAIFYAAPGIAQTADFTLSAPAGMTATPATNRQFDTGFGVGASDGSIPVAGTSQYPCLIGFKFNSANAGLTRAEINKTTASAEWRAMVRGFIGVLFTLQGERPVTLQGYTGVELAVVPKAGPDADKVRGLMTLLETPKGRMTSVCMTTSAAYGKAERRFRALPRGARLPE